MRKTGTKVEMYEPQHSLTSDEPRAIFKVEKLNKRDQKALDKESQNALSDFPSFKNEQTLPSSDGLCLEQLDSNKAPESSPKLTPTFQSTLDDIKALKLKTVSALSLAMPALY